MATRFSSALEIGSDGSFCKVTVLKVHITAVDHTAEISMLSSRVPFYLL